MPTSQLKSYRSEEFPYHGIAYGFEGQVLEEDDFRTQPPIDIPRRWAIILSNKEYPGMGGFGPGQKNVVDNIIITGPDGYYKKYSMWELAHYSSSNPVEEIMPKIKSLLPQSLSEGPPLPKGLAIKWPWKEKG